MTTRHSDWWSLSIAVGCAAVAAVLELAIVAGRKLIGGEMMIASWQILWLTPLSWILLFAVLGLALVGFAAIARRVFTPWVLAFAVSLPAAFSVLFLFHPALHRWAVVALSLGVASQAARWLSSDPRRASRASRRAFVATGSLAVLGGVAFNVARAVGDRRALAALGPSADGAPNILFLVLDTVRAKSLALYGGASGTTPAIEQLAARGVTYRTAIATAPWTLPSHASMLTGRYPHELSADWREPLDDAVPTLAEVLGARGYRSAGFVANVAYCGREVGLHRGFSHYEDFVISPWDLVTSSSLGRFVADNPRLRGLIGHHDILARKRASDVGRAFLRWKRRDATRPYFAFLNYYDAHEPYLPPDSLRSRFALAGRDLAAIRPLNTRMAERAGKAAMTPAQRELERRAYEASIAALDADIGRLLETLAKEGELENTIVVLTSDHGEQFGEHELFSHGNSLYLPVLHVPLVIAYPRKLPTGVWEEATVSLRDLAATTLSLAGLDSGGHPLLPGAPLAPAAAALGRWSGDAGSPALSEVTPAPNQPAEYPSHRGVMRSLVAEGHHYIRNGDGAEELYALAGDQAELRDLIATADSAMVRRMRAIVDSLSPSSVPGRGTDAPRPLSGAR